MGRREEGGEGESKEEAGEEGNPCEAQGDKRDREWAELGNFVMRINLQSKINRLMASSERYVVFPSMIFQSP